MTSSAATHRRLTGVADPYDGVLSRDLLRAHGVDHHAITRQVEGARWRLLGRQAVALNHDEPSLRALAWRALWEVRRAGAAIDGATALELAGLTGYQARTVTVSVPWETRVLRVSGVSLHRVCRLPDELLLSGLPRVKPVVATIRAAHWAATDRQAALLLTMPVQQRLVHAPHLGDAVKVEHVRGRRELVRQLVTDIVDGAHSLGELDFALMCRRRGLPEPDRQVVVHTARGRVYLDVRWTAIGLVVEIDGSGHRQGLQVVDDNLRQNAVTLGGDAVLRFDLLALRLVPTVVMDQLERAYALFSARAAS